MKTVTLFRKALLVGLASMVLVSCGKEEPDSGITNEPEKEEQ
jgi:hypothetical protein